MRHPAAWLVVLASALPGARAQLPELRPESLGQWHAAIAPCEDELAWRRVGWRPTFQEAVDEAYRTQRPILLWAMNGHPLGCT